jgi:hypothetical protein
MYQQLLQYRQQPGPVVREVWIEVLDVVAGWLGATAVCMPEGKNRARAGLRDRQAFTWRGAWIQFGSSQAPAKAAEKTIWPVSRPWEAAAPSSRSKGFMRQDKLSSSCSQARRSHQARITTS